MLPEKFFPPLEPSQPSQTVPNTGFFGRDGRLGRVELRKKINPNALEARRAKRVIAKLQRWLTAATDHRRVGRIGEMLVRTMLITQGWKVYPNLRKQRGDIQATDRATGEYVRFEVKTAKAGHDGRFRYRFQADGKTNVMHSDFAVLIAADDSGGIWFYLIPTAALADIRTFTMSHPTRYTGKLAPFRLRSERLNIQSANEIYGLMGVSSCDS